MIEVLVQCGADLEAKNKQGKTALDNAENCRPDIEEIIKNAMEKKSNGQALMEEECDEKIDYEAETMIKKASRNEEMIKVEEKPVQSKSLVEN